MRLPTYPGILACALIALTASHAQIPQLLNYQGRVAVGSPAVNFNGAGQFKFALVNTNGATTYWSNDGTSTAGSQPAAAVALTVTNGLYSILLGDTALTNMTAVPTSIFSNSDVRLRVWFDDGVNGFQLLAPDQRIVSVGYAMTADAAQTAMTANMANSATTAGTAMAVADGAITSAKLASGAVTSTAIASGAIGCDQLASDAVNSETIVDGSVTSADIADGAITTSKIANSSVTNAKLVNSGIAINGTNISLGGSETVSASAGTLTGDTLASGVTTSSLTRFGPSPAITTPTLNGVVTRTGADVTTFTPMVGTIIDVTLNNKKSFNTTPLNLSFSNPTPTPDTFMPLILTNTGPAATVNLATSCISAARGGTISSFTHAAGTTIFLTFHYNGNAWEIYGDPTNLNYALTDQANSFSAIQRVTNTTDSSNGGAGAAIIDGGLFVQKNVISGSQLQAGGGSYMSFTGRAVWKSPADGVLTYTKGNLTTGMTLDFATPDTLQVKNAANNADGTIKCGSISLSGIPRFNGTNATGTGSAALGTNSPAVTNTAPYTWIQVITSDGSTAYIPAWK